MTKHQALRSFLFEEKEALRDDIAHIRRELEYQQEQLAEAQKELNAYPFDHEITGLDALSYQELVEKAVDATAVPDDLLVEDYLDDGTDESTYSFKR